MGKVVKIFLILLTLTSLSIFLVFAYFVVALSTNWFHDQLPAGSSIVMVPLAVISLLVLILHLRSLLSKKQGWIINSLPFLSTIVGIAMMVSFEGGFPNWSSNEITRSALQTLPTDRGDIIYYIELNNSFSSSHKEYLVMSRSGQENRVQIPIFKQKNVTAFLYSGDPSDWCVLEKTGNPDVYILNIGWHLRESRFLIDTTKGVVKEVTSALDFHRVR